MLRCQLRKQGVFSIKGCNTSFALFSKMPLNILLPLKSRFVLRATNSNFNPLLFYFERSHLLCRQQIILISNQTAIRMRLMNSVFIRLHIAARAWTPFAKRGTKLMKRKIWKLLRGRYGDVCIGMQFCVCVCMCEASRSVPRCKTHFSLQLFQVISFLFFFPCSLSDAHHPLARHSTNPSCLWSPMLLTLSRKAGFNLAAAAWKMEQNLASYERARVHINTQRLCQSISASKSPQHRPFLLPF